MALTFDELERILEPAGGAINAAGQAFQTPALFDLFSTYFAGSALSLTDATATPDATRQTVTVSGKFVSSTFLSIPTATLTDGVFQLLADGTVAMRLPISVGGTGWKLSDSLPLVAGTIFDDLTWANTVFTVDSADPIVVPADLHERFGLPPGLPVIEEKLVSGLSMQSDVSFRGGGSLLPIFGGFFSTPLTMTGPIEGWLTALEAGEPASLYPQLLLEVAPQTAAAGYANPVQIGDYEMSFTFAAACVLQQFTDEEGGVALLTTGGVRLDTALPATVPVPLILRYFGAGSSLLLTAGDVPQAPIPAEDLPSLLNNTSTGGLLNPGFGFPVAESVILREASMTLLPSPLTLQNISITVGFEADWSPFQGVFTIEEIGIELNVNNLGGSFTPSAAVYTIGFLGDDQTIALDTFVGLPGLDFQLTLVDSETPLNVSGLVQNLIGNAIDLQTITGNTFELTGSPKTGSYTFVVVINQEWTIFGTAPNDLTLTSVILRLAKEPLSTQAMVAGTIGLAGVPLLLMATWTSTDGWLFAGGTDPSQSVSLTSLFGDLARLFGSELPPGMPEITLDQLWLQLRQKTSTFTLDAAITFRNAAFSLTSLPLVGQFLDASSEIRLSTVALHVTNAQTAQSDLRFRVLFGKTNSADVVIPLRRPQQQTAVVPAAGGIVYPAEGSGLFLSVQRTFGPVQVDKIGFTLDSRGIGVQLVGSLTAAGLTLDILGAGVVVPLSSDDAPSFFINGLGVTYRSAAVNVTGALLRVTSPGFTQFDGVLVVVAQQFSLAVLGSYAVPDPPSGEGPSFFFFGLLAAPIGGPPFFFITGICGGFGYNRELLIPTIDQVQKYPLVAAAEGKNVFGTDPQLPQFIAGMKKYMVPRDGQYWFAAGLQFTSFQLVDSFALVTVAFGERLQIAFLGRSTISVPPKAPVPVARAELVVAAVFAPDDGIFWAAAQLTPESYIYASACQLTGGFAVSYWFSPNKNAGDFVVTLGGYNPFFTVPAHYPNVPRVGANWKVEGVPLSIKGGFYFALTPHSIMAGGMFEAVWDSGPLRAWFTLHADFLIRWKPFFYDVRAGVSFGVRATVDLKFVTVSISLTLGAELHIWGPEFSGVATLDLGIATFRISFGADTPAPPPIPWDDFKSSFLPRQSSTSNAPAAAGGDAVVVKVLVPSGLLQELQNDVVQYVVDPQHFSLVTQSVIPSKKLFFNDDELTGGWKTEFGIGPMKVLVDQLESEHRVNVTLNGEAYPFVSSSVNLAPVPKGLWLWQDALGSSLNEEGQIPEVAQGLTITPTVRTPQFSATVPIANLLYSVVATEEVSWGDDIAPTTDPWTGDDPWTELTETIADPEVGLRRVGIIASLFDNAFLVEPQVDVAPLTDRNKLALLAPPVLNLLGENPNGASGGSPSPPRGTPRNSEEPRNPR